MKQFLGHGGICLLNLLVLAPLGAAALAYGYAIAAGVSRAGLAKSGDNTIWIALAVFAIALWLLQAAALLAWYRFGRGAEWWATSGMGPRILAFVLAGLAGATTSALTTWIGATAFVLKLYSK